MHPVFRISELFAVVLVYCDKKTLARLARVCRGLHEPTVALLWNSSDYLRDLLVIFPEDAFSHADGFRCKRLRTPIVAQQLERFIHYSQHVRMLSLNLFKLHPGTLHPIMRQNHVPYIFPKLVHLKLQFPSPLYDYPVSSIIPLLSSALIKLDIKGEYHYTLPLHPGEFFAILPSRSPGLTHLIIDAFLSPQLVSGELVSCIRRLSKLKVLHISRGDIVTFSDLILPLGELQFLEDLKMPLSITQDSFGLETTSGLAPNGLRPYFPSLRRINFTPLNSLASVTQILRAVGTIPLESAIFKTNFTARRDEMMQLATALQESCSSTLRSLRILKDRQYLWIESGAADQSQTQVMVDGPALSPLFAISSLVDFRIEHRYPLDITDRFLESACHAWPNLVHLKLNPDPLRDWTTFQTDPSPEGTVRNPIRPLVTFRGVASLVTRCSKLKNLGILFDATRLNHDGEITTRPSRSSVLHLDVGRSWIEAQSFDLIALLLSEVFPSLRSLARGTSPDEIRYWGRYPRIWWGNMKDHLLRGT